MNLDLSIRSILSLYSSIWLLQFTMDLFIPLLAKYTLAISKDHRNSHMWGWGPAEIAVKLPPRSTDIDKAKRETDQSFRFSCLVMYLIIAPRSSLNGPEGATQKAFSHETRPLIFNSTRTYTHHFVPTFPRFQSAKFCNNKDSVSLVSILASIGFGLFSMAYKPRLACIIDLHLRLNHSLCV